MSANAGNVPKVTGLPLSSSGRLTNNVLLVKDLVGKTRPTVYTLPGLEHVYGKRVERDPNESAATGEYLRAGVATGESGIMLRKQ